MPMTAIREFQINHLAVKTFPNREQLGRAAAKSVAGEIRRLQDRRESVRMIFAAAPSQNEFLAALAAEAGIDWASVVAFHMDEYLGLAAGAPQGFGSFLRERLFDRIRFREVHYINPSPVDVEAECNRYAALLAEAAIDIVCMGVGENGHIAFNDPPVADFHDRKMVKAVTLEQACRQQQVNDGCFATLEEVPKRAITLTVPALIAANFISLVVPGPTKARAVRNMLEGPISESCPASVLRRHPRARLYLDRDSAAELTTDH